jgi:bifunctional non-homologous end joining protein LigD
MTTVIVGRRRLEISNPDKVLFPDDGITKAELADYYRAVAPVMLPQVRDRPLMLQRFPHGIGRPGFVQKEASHFPDWISRIEVAKQRGTVTHVVANDAATLVYLADQACITLHPWLSRGDRLRFPDQLIFDLDPSSDDLAPVVAGAGALRGLLLELTLTPFVKTTGSRGLHIVVPLARSADFDTVRRFAGDVATVLIARDPDALTLEGRKENRRGRVYVDIQRNAYAQTAVAPYSVRALTGAPVAAPLFWEELDEPNFHPRRHTLRTMASRMSERGDPWARMFRRARSLREAQRRLERIQRTLAAEPA